MTIKYKLLLAVMVGICVVSHFFPQAWFEYDAIPGMQATVPVMPR